MPSFILFYIFVVFSPRGVCSENASERKMEGGAQEANVVATAEGLRQRLVEAVSGGPTLPYHILLPYLMVKLGTACSTVPCTCSTGSTEGWPKVAKSARKNRSQKKVSRGDKIRGWIASIPLPETSPPPEKKRVSLIYMEEAFSSGQHKTQISIKTANLLRISCTRYVILRTTENRVPVLHIPDQKSGLYRYYTCLVEIRPKLTTVSHLYRVDFDCGPSVCCEL